MDSEHLYWYEAGCDNVVDGDTLDLTIDLGFRIHATHRVRILGIDTPELRSSDPDERERAKAAKQAAEAWIVNALDLVTANGSYKGGRYLLVRTEKADSFGRYLAHIRNSNGESLGEHLLETGHATLYTP